MGLEPSCPLRAEDLKESKNLGNFVLDENSMPFDDLDRDSFARKTLRPVDLLEAKCTNYMASNPICYPYL